MVDIKFCYASENVHKLTKYIKTTDHSSNRSGVSLLHLNGKCIKMTPLYYIMYKTRTPKMQYFLSFQAHINHNIFSFWLKHWHLYKFRVQQFWSRLFSYQSTVTKCRIIALYRLKLLLSNIYFWMEIISFNPTTINK